ncbi:MAG: helix-turn-helix domain-containing protein [Firmicutes bacterium]|nr:helix-turn-helix domain-containing protein [Bacillota bacterium]
MKSDRCIRNDSNQEMEFLTVDELAKYLRIGRSAAYEICRQPDFPVVRIGRTIRIPRARLIGWIEQGGSSVPRD